VEPISRNDTLRTMVASPERFDPTSMDGLIAAEHLGRYRFASSLAAGRSVLDAGCGFGYGTAALAAAGAERAVGVDISADAIATAAAGADSSCEYVRADLLDLPFDDDTFELAVCFEAIEHVVDAGGVIDELRRVVRSDGILVVSSPNPKIYPEGNPHHVRELSVEELHSELGSRFSNTDLYYQHVWVATAILREPTFTGPAADIDADLAHAGTRNDQLNSFTIAVAGDVELPRLRETVYLAAPIEHRRLLQFSKVARAAKHARNMAHSRSWRWTRPFRALAGAIRRLRGRGSRQA
jgi:SAM-dependent methyltransferase